MKSVESILKEIYTVKVVKKYISSTELEDLYYEILYAKEINEDTFSGYKDFIRLSEKLSLIEPLKNSKFNYGIYSKYKVLITKEKKSNPYENELKTQLHFLLSSDFYLKNPEEYEKDRLYVLQINQFLINNKKYDNNILAINERSYEIFEDEKFMSGQNLETKDIFKNICKRLGIFNIEKTFKCYKTKEMFQYSIYNTNSKNILIIENKDTYVSVCRDLSLGNTVFDKDFYMVIYGEGEKIVSSFVETINNYPSFNIFKGEAKYNFFYWGDVDIEGFKIFHSLLKKIKSDLIKDCNISISLLEIAYQKMLDKYKIKNDNRTNNQSVNYISTFEQIQFKDNDLKTEIKCIISKNKYIPQEIITMADRINFERKLFDE